MLRLLPDTRLQAGPGWMLELYFLYPGVICVSVSYGSPPGSKLLIPVDEGKLQGVVGGNDEGFDREREGR